MSLIVAAPADAGEPSVAFNKDIRPILTASCFKCHGTDLQKGGLDLRQRDGAVKVLKSGNKAIAPGRSADSALIQRVTADDDEQRMPPKSKGARLTPEQIARLRAWIDQGAKYEQHWSYAKPLRPPLPVVKNKSWPKNDLDYFVLARLEKEGLSPSPEADRVVLIRRVSLDLIGLPPTVKEVDDFLSDQAPNAYEKVVDRLLSSKHYGERQARPWLDMARYADTNGYEKDERRSIWPYRDWVINAFNRDLPFDQFTIEQLAGDLLANATLEQKVATGFHRNTMVNTEGGTDDEEFRVAAVVDRVNTTMEVWMGTTMNCVQCHNHKYDPFTTKEYYSLFAFFNSTTDHGRSNEPTLSLPTPEQQARNKRLRAEMVATAVLPVGGTALSVPGLLRFGQSRLAALKLQEAGNRPATTLVLQEQKPPRTTNILIRGNHHNKGDRVMPATPAAWHPLKQQGPQSVSLNRLDFARWLVDRDNPLVGRVIMNRVWAQYFGRGIVETSEDFGVQGDPPTHPELLDWLATEFVRVGWRQKAMHKAIVMSATYRQASKVTPELHERDPYNRLFARGPRFRLEAEMVRDNALAISGLLNRKIGGPSVFPYQPDGVWFNPYSQDKWVTSTRGDQYRRGLYTFWRRTAPYAAFTAFDAPSREVACERRPRTNTPLQALATLNDKVFVECSAALARRMMKEAGPNVNARATYGFRLCVTRMPRDAELEQLHTLFRESLDKYQKNSTAARAMATAGGMNVPPGMNVAELAAWTVVANVLLNLDETVTKG
jgi:hypothetical protein